ncbi:hypothetical protein [Streptomyces sp. NBC_01264]|uniref:hypothetical protein n=1 Tax=Streptomyces sp. NBC_01264 TaxID=2903804 RepID=UPI002259CA94|nr:hypothetical protein [Streptomyces sp. NBC_01264]MCX4784507.1 hypothetical protein [Streptomyces sp. NBC_01264]
MDTLTLEDGVYPRRAVVAAGIRVDLFDPLGQLDVTAPSLARLGLCTAPAVLIFDAVFDDLGRFGMPGVWGLELVRR